jgi:glucosamine 6-phosphate synthetase-like amidotransferase/phosphosugar isomerase protein
MCGIHGIINKRVITKGDSFLSDAFVANTLRGEHSSGIGTVKLSKQLYDAYKLPYAGPLFRDAAYAKRLIRQGSESDTLAICHVRHATVGGISVDTAHPFIASGEGDSAGRIVMGVHNGTLTGWSSKKNARYYSVDSEWAINEIMERGYEAFKDFTGAYCFAWWDSDSPGVLNIARNKERPMHIAFLEQGGMAYASEGGMLHWLLERNDIKRKGDILELDAGQHYRFHVDSLENFTKTALPEVKQVSTTSTSSNYGTQYAGRYTNYRTHKEKVDELLAKISSGQTEDKKGTVIETPITKTSNVAPFPIPKHKNVSEAEWKAADDMTMLGVVLEFSPMASHNKCVYGTAVYEKSELAAEVPDYDMDAREDETWYAAVIGIREDSNNEFTVLLAPPVRKTRSVKAVH